MSNRHIVRANQRLAQLKADDFKNPLVTASAAQTGALLAIAYELKTTNRIAALTAGFHLGHDHEDTAWADEIMPRLGLGDTK